MTPVVDSAAHPEERLAALEDALNARTFELDVLHELSAKLGRSLTYEELSLVILTHLGQGLRYDVAASLLTAPDGGHNLHVRAVRRLTPASRNELEARLLAACNRLTRATLSREDIRVVTTTEEQAGPEIDRFGSFFQVPILADGIAAGLIFVGAAAENQFQERHLRLLYTVSNHAAASLRRMQEFQEAERRRLATVVRHLPDGVVLLDPDQRVVLANPTGQQYLEALGDGHPGEVLTTIAHKPFTELVAPASLVISMPGSPARTVVATAVRLRDGLAEGWLLVFRDETEVREAVRRRDDFMAMLGHELRNPLAAVTSATELLRREDSPAHVRGKAVDILGRQFSHLKRLVDDLLETSRFLRGKIPVVREPIDLVEVVSRAVQAHAPAFDLEGRILEIDLPAGEIRVEGDGARLRQVLDNLLGNARKFTPVGGRTCISCAVEGPEAVVRVRDSGLGIPPDKLTAIFEPFFQCDDSLDRERGGLGLGLAVVKSLVDSHGGRVSVHSDGPGQGSEFSVWLPVLSGEDNAESSRPAAAGTGKRVLVVEDEPDVLAMLRAVLTLDGHEVATAASGSEALAAFREHGPDVSFIDLGLPGMDGFQLAQLLRLEPHRPACRLIALSGYAQPADVERSRQAGFDFHLAKPVRLEDLQKFLR